MHLTSTSAVSIRLVAIGAIIMEALIFGAVLPADWTNTRVAILAVRVAQGTIFFFIVCTRGERLTRCTAVSLFPARVRHISVMIIVLEVMDRCAIVILLGVSKRLFRGMGEAWHILLVIVVWVFHIFAADITLLPRIIILEVFIAVVNNGLGHRLVNNDMCGWCGIMKYDMLGLVYDVLDVLMNDRLVNDVLVNNVLMNEVCVLCR